MIRKRYGIHWSNTINNLKTVLAGMKRKGNVPAGVTLRDAFSGKEDQQPDFGVPWLDFGARAYSPALRRWMVPDPLGEKYRGINLCDRDPCTTLRGS